ncbi:MAG: sigma-54-dependent Fis family transcriptional regulator [Candidatus Rokubacteria bacterium]|nr:sigma-54-dependent Fis family transcriptional regulator [Candidatus Rokubacteria bacterium]
MAPETLIPSSFSDHALASRASIPAAADAIQDPEALNPPGALKILVVDDEPVMRELLREALTGFGHRVAVAASGREALRLIRAESFQVLLLDLRMPGMDGLDVLKAVRTVGYDIEVVVLTGYADVESAVAAMKLGAHDYLRKPIDLSELEQVARRAVAFQCAKGRPEAVRAASGDRASLPLTLLGVDPKIAAVRKIVELVAPTDATVVITGESGTGKELVARLIHTRSLRAAGPLVVVDCPSVPVSLFESELFGHERGAFTGAVAKRRGKVEEANGGTLFLDEVGELPHDVQAKCLRFLQHRQVTRIGGNLAVNVDTRVIAATNRDLVAMAEEGAFRRDLFHRLSVVEIDLPALRERKEDIPLLATHFVERFCQAAGMVGKEILPDCLALLSAYPWPGNVRELENVIQRASILTLGPALTPESLPPRVLRAITPSDVGPLVGPETLAEIDKRHVLEVLRREQWNISRAARVLGIHRATLYRKVMALGLRPDHIRTSESG